jgi:hypothetical protein
LSSVFSISRWSVTSCPLTIKYWISPFGPSSGRNVQLTRRLSPPAARRIQHRHQRGNRVQRSGDKATLNCQRALRALPLPLRLFLQPDPVVQLQPRHGLPAQNFQQG